MTRSRTTKETKINPINTIQRKTFLPSLFGLIAIPQIINSQQNQFLIFQQERLPVLLLKNSYQLDLNPESVVSRRDVAGELILGVNQVGYV